MRQIGIADRATLRAAGAGAAGLAVALGGQRLLDARERVGAAPGWALLAVGALLVAWALRGSPEFIAARRSGE